MTDDFRTRVERQVDQAIATAISDGSWSTEYSRHQLVQARASLLALVEEAVKAAKRDAFYGGYCCALSAALYGHDGTSTEYLEAVGAVDERELLAYAKQEGDMELPRIKAAIRWLKARRRDTKSRTQHEDAETPK